MCLSQCGSMAEGRDGGYLSPLEEQYIREAEADGDLDQQLLREKDLAAQRLWLAFQDSATAVSHLFRGRAFASLYFSHKRMCVCVCVSTDSRKWKVLASFPGSPRLHSGK